MNNSRSLIEYFMMLVICFIVIMALVAIFGGCRADTQTVVASTPAPLPDGYRIIEVSKRLQSLVYMHRTIDLEACMVCYTANSSMWCVPAHETSLDIGCGR